MWGGKNVSHFIYPHLHPIHENCVQKEVHKCLKTHLQVLVSPACLAPSRHWECRSGAGGGSR